MATVLTEEEKKKKAIGYSFPQNPPPGGSIYRSREPSTPSSGLGVVSEPSLDAQAASDRQAISGAWGQVKDVNQKLGAAIADIGTMPIRAAAGAYDTAVIRPMRAAGLNAAFMSPMVNPGSNADGSSMTPFMDQIRAKEGQPNTANPVQPATTAPRVMGSSVGGASQNQRMEGGPIATPGAPGTTQNPIIAKPGESVQQAAKTGGGLGVTRIDKPGESPLFTNIAGGDNMMARGAPSAQNVGAMDALAARYAGGAPAAAQPQQPVYGGMASMGTGTNTGGFGILDANYQRERALRMDASDSRNPGESRRAYEARIAGAVGALNAFRGEQTAAPRLAAAQRSMDAKTQADMALANRKMAFDEAQGGARMGLDVLRQTDEAKTNAMRRDALGMDMEKAKALDAARQEYLAAGDDPAKQQAAARKLQVLSGKDNQKEAKWNSVVVGGGTNELGQKVGGTAMLYNESTGEVRPIGDQQAQAVAGQAPTGPAAPKTKAEYDALPPGTRYLHSDGTIKIKAGK